MIFSSIHANDNAALYPKAIQKAIDFLKNHDFASMEPGRYEIDGDNIFANLMDATTKAHDEVKPETHKEYIDVQFVVSGKEKLGFAADTGYTPSEHPDGSDVYFYDSVDDESYVIALPGCYSIFFPSDLHRPCVCVDAPAAVRKVVVKVHVSLI